VLFFFKVPHFEHLSSETGSVKISSSQHANQIFKYPLKINILPNVFSNLLRVPQKASSQFPARSFPSASLQAAFIPQEVQHTLYFFLP